MIKIKMSCATKLWTVKIWTELFNIVNSIKLSNYKNDLQQKFGVDITDLKQSKNVFVFANKTSNIYKISTERHKKLLGENITKTCKKAPVILQRSINLEAKHIAKKIKLSERIDKLAETPTYVALKDHKDKFRPSPSCPLINPSKSEIGKLSKIILENISKSLLSQLKYN